MILRNNWKKENTDSFQGLFTKQFKSYTRGLINSFDCIWIDQINEESMYMALFEIDLEDYSDKGILKKLGYFSDNVKELIENGENHFTIINDIINYYGIMHFNVIGLIEDNPSKMEDLISSTTDIKEYLENQKIIYPFIQEDSNSAFIFVNHAELAALRI